MQDRIGEMLLSAGILDEEKLKSAFDYQRNKGGTVYGALVKLDYLDEDDLVEFLSRQLGLPTVDLDKIDVDPDAAQMIVAQKAKKYIAIPYRQVESSLHVAMADPTDLNAIDDIKFMTNLSVEVSIATETQIKKALDIYYDSGLHVEDMLEEFQDDDLKSIGSDTGERAEEAPIVKLVNYILREAITKKASDIHIEPGSGKLLVRLRIDGELYEIMKPPLKLATPLANRVKVMSKLDEAKKLEPQQGVFKLQFSRNRYLNFRVAVLPTAAGERVVIRLIDQSILNRDMSQLGFDEGPLRSFTEAIHRRAGLILITGPAGSGKTTTLYKAVSSLAATGVNIFSVEDFIEIHLKGVNQVSANPKAGMHLSSLVKTIVETQDADVLMISEIRDAETALAAVKAVQAGILVLAGFCARNTASALREILDMGVLPHRLASTVTLVSTQWLVRRICPDCKKELAPQRQALSDLGVKMEDIESFRVHQGTGCSVCHGTGFRGRLGLYEVMPISEEIRELILSGASALRMHEESRRNGMETLKTAGLNKVRQGLTTIPEVVRLFRR